MSETLNILDLERFGGERRQALLLRLWCRVPCCSSGGGGGN